MAPNNKRQELAHGEQPAKILSRQPYILAVRRRTERGWDVLVSALLAAPKGRRRPSCPRGQEG